MAKLGNAAAAIKPKGGGSVKAKVIGGIILVVIVIIVLAGIFNFASTDTNRIGLHYGGGVVEAEEVQVDHPARLDEQADRPGRHVVHLPDRPALVHHRR